MTALIVIASIICFVTLLFLVFLFLVAKIGFRYDTDTGVFGLSLKILFVKINILPVDEEKRRRKEAKNARRLARRLAKGKGVDGHLFEKKEKDAKTVKEIEKNANDAADSKKTFAEKIEAFGKLAASIRKKIKILVPGFAGALAFDIKKLDIVVGTGDAAQTAISYGVVCGIVESLYAVGNRCKKFRVSDKVYVAADYLEPKFKCEFDIVLKVRVFRILTTVLKAFSQK